MRLLILFPDRALGWAVRDALADGFDRIDLCGNAGGLLTQAQEYDLIAMHHCLPGLDGCSAGRLLAEHAPLCPPRILLIAPPEFLHSHPWWADAVLHNGVSAQGIARTLMLLAQKPLPKLAAVHEQTAAAAVDGFLDELALDGRLKGRAYAAWMLRRLAVSPLLEGWPVSRLYQACAQAFGVTPCAVERCLRVAVEAVFTQGSLTGIERLFGEATDPERGKLTNRAFLLQSCRRLRYSLAAACSPNSREMHQSPAAPTSV